MFQPIRSQGGHLVFPIGPKNTNLVEDVEILLPVKFRWLLPCDIKGKVKNVSANQKLGRPSCFSDLLEQNLVDDIEILLPVKFRWIPFNGFRGEVENVSANHRPGRQSCFFSLGPKNTNLVEDVNILLFVKFRWIPFSGFRGEVENVKRRTTDGQGTTHDHNSALELLAQVH